MKWVIDYLLTENDIFILRDCNLLSQFVSCSKSVVINSIIKYINSDTANKDVVDILKEYYSDKIHLKESFEDEEVLNKFITISEINYNSVKPSLSLSTLKQMKETIESVIGENELPPYINKVSPSIINDIIECLNSMYKHNKNSSYRELVFRLNKNKSLFKDNKNANAKGTPAKNVYKKIPELKIIIKGIDFLIDKLENDINPNSWRVF